MLRSVPSTAGWLALQEVTSDATCIPIRGADWNSGGHWLRIHRHQWMSGDPLVSQTWSSLYQGVHACNRLLALLEEVTSDEKQPFIAEVRGVRALYYYWLLDAFGSIPLYLEFDVFELPGKSTTKEVSQFIENELLAILPDLSPEVNTTTYGRVNQDVAKLILARLYLNAETYTELTRWTDVLAICDDIISSGHYSLSSDYFDNFDLDNHTSTENIFAIPFQEGEIPGFNLVMASLHSENRRTFNLESQPWNGWCALEDFFNAYDDHDVRKGDGEYPGSFLYGIQFSFEGDTLFQDTTIHPIYPPEPDGNLVNLTPSIRALDNAYQQDGARFIKYEVKNGMTADMDNDFPVYRYAQVLLMKAEVLWRLDREAEALELLNVIRERAGLEPVFEISDEILLTELGKEFFLEAHRRTDLIRFGKFNDEWWEKPPSDECRRFMPIPYLQLEENPNLIQNPCYQ